MKKLFLILTLLLLTTASFIPINSAKPEISTAQELVPYLRQMKQIAEKNHLNIDWNKIKGIDIAPLSDNIQGIWLPESKTVLISYFLQFPRNNTLSKKEKDEFILIVLAHEIGHSQGLKHTAPDAIDLMSPDSRYLMLVIRGMGAEQFIVNSFTRLKE